MNVGVCAIFCSCATFCSMQAELCERKCFRRILQYCSICSTVPFVTQWFVHPPANFLYKMVVPAPQEKTFFYRECLLISWIPEPVLYHFTFMDPCVGIFIFYREDLATPFYRENISISRSTSKDYFAKMCQTSSVFIAAVCAIYRIGG